VTRKKTNKDRGQVLAAAVGASGLNIEDVAKKADYSRAAYYKHIKNSDLEFHVLIAYGKALHYDFTDEFPEMPKYLLEEPGEVYGKPKSLDEALQVIEQLKNKYMELLEKYHLLMEEKVGKK